MSQNPAFAYRPDIDGLRAIAVLAVVLYHFGFGFSGGFIGVDVFFVISGFLIAGIIKREIDEGRFTFTGFYERRIRRIFPALFSVLAVTLLFGYFVLLPTDMILLGKSTIATLLFGSNVFFWRNSGYFDSVSDLNPLLHTWSLAVEEQFYFVFPMLLLLAYKYVRNAIKPLLAIAIISSFALCFWQQPHRPNATFYLLPFRAWELGIGAAAALGLMPVTGRLVNQVLSWIGLAMIVLGIVFIPSGNSYPGWHALVPVFGTLFVIHSGIQNATWVSRLLSSGPLVSIGLISYSLYLWHWPVLVFANYIDVDGRLNQWAMILILIATVIISYGSYRWVEKPFRRKGDFGNTSKVYITAGVTAAMLILVGFSAYHTNGYPRRYPEAVVSADSQRNQVVAYRECFGKGVSVVDDKACYLGNKNVEPSVLLFGDSHAASIAPAIDKVLAEAGKSGLVIPSSSCPPLLNVGTTQYLDCIDNNKEIFDFIQSNSKIELVILHGFWVSYTGRDEKNGDPRNWLYVGDTDNLGQFSFDTEIKNTLRHLSGLNRDVLVIGPVSSSPMSVNDIAFRRIQNAALDKPISFDEFKRNKADKYISAVSGVNYKNVYFFEPSKYLCKSGNCFYMHEESNLFRDFNHLSIKGAEYLSPFIRNELIRINFLNSRSEKSVK